jgi:cobalt-zinc-cadmium efflux system outer membrane protein
MTRIFSIVIIGSATIFLIGCASHPNRTWFTPKVQSEPQAASRIEQSPANPSGNNLRTSIQTVGFERAVADGDSESNAIDLATLPNERIHVEPRNATAEELETLENKFPQTGELSEERKTPGQLSASLQETEIGAPVADAAGNCAQPMDLAEVERLALAQHPAIEAAYARVEALRGTWLQSGLRPNPEMGYMSEVGDTGTAGQQGIYLNREFVRGGKLEKNREIVCAQIAAAESELEIQRLKVTTDARTLFYSLLASQQRVRLSEEYLESTHRACDASDRLYDAGEIAEIAVLQTSLQSQTAEVLLRQTEVERQAVARQLAALLGYSGDPADLCVAGELIPAAEELSIESLTQQLISSSPEIARSYAELERQQRNLDRQYAEQKPNLFLQTSVRHNVATSDELIGVQLGRAIQTNNWNQGNIRAAQSAIIAASQDIERVRRSLATRVATAVRSLNSAGIRVRRYQTEILPTARKIFDMADAGFRAGETDYLDLITAQKSYLQASLDYNTALQEYWAAHVLLDGFLVSGSLQGN